MNRRDFLKSLAAIGGAIAIPFDAIAIAPDLVINQAWQAAIAAPVTFYVNEYGAISTEADPYASTTRLALLELEEVFDIRMLISLALEEWRVANLIEEAMADDEAADPEGDWQTWLAQADSNTVDDLISETNDWLDGEPDERDWEKANHRGYSGRGAALSYFRDCFEDNDLLDIVIVEGDCPGSSYFAAELRMSLPEANALVEEHGIPIRFEWEA